MSQLCLEKCPPPEIHPIFDIGLLTVDLAVETNRHIRFHTKQSLALCPPPA